MNRHLLHILVFPLFCIAFILLAFGCEYMEEQPVPIFPKTDHMTAEYVDNEFLFYPSEDVEYIVIGFFNRRIVTIGKRIVNMDDMEGGSCTGLSGFTRSRVPDNALYVYDQASMFFTGLAGAYVPSGTLYWAVWGFNADWVIISSSDEIMTDFP